MWVESDTNMVGGEAMARQLLVGQRWFDDHLGVNCEEVWLPDSFGYTAALPQIVKLAGCRWFLTQKISWNTTNVFPHHTFWWEGIDGTRVFTHFPPVDTYTAELTGAELAHAARNFRDKGAATRSLVPFGHGDGGGGPTREMLGARRAHRDLAGSPQVEVESPAAFFEAAEEEYADRAGVGGRALPRDPPRHLHLAGRDEAGQPAQRAPAPRGRAVVGDGGGARAARLPSRRARAALGDRAAAPVPRHPARLVDRLGAPRGAGDVRRVEGELEAIVDRALDALAGGGDRDVVFNAGPVARDGVAALSAGFETVASATSSTGERCATTSTAMGFSRTSSSGSSWTRGGVIRSRARQGAGREVLPPGGAANLLQLHPDHPVKWDAWDLDRSYRARVTDLTEGEVTVDGDAVVGDPQLRRLLGHAADQARRRPAVVVERGRLARAREGAQGGLRRRRAHGPGRYETQFGHVVRPTHENTTWDAARFEVCAHRWVHVGEGGYGVALANDATYGHDVTRHPREGGGTYSRVRLRLLRAPRFPDPETDQGRHVFCFALVPGAAVADAAEAGYALNLPLRRRTGGPCSRSCASTGRRTSRRSSSPRTARATSSSGSTSRWVLAPRRGSRRPSTTARSPRSTCWSGRWTRARGTARLCPATLPDRHAAVRRWPEHRFVSGLLWDLLRGDADESVWVRSGWALLNQRGKCDSGWHAHAVPSPSS